MSEDECRSSIASLHEIIVRAHGSAFPQYAYCGPQETVELMLAEITTARTERDQARALAELETKRLDLLKTGGYVVVNILGPKYGLWSYDDEQMAGGWYDTPREAIDAKMDRHISGRGMK